jgi:hypothetical protein
MFYTIGIKLETDGHTASAKLFDGTCAYNI